jgi:hypothetical protein
LSVVALVVPEEASSARLAQIMTKVETMARYGRIQVMK